MNELLIDCYGGNDSAETVINGADMFQLCESCNSFSLRLENRRAVSVRRVRSGVKRHFGGADVLRVVESRERMMNGG